MSDVIGLPKPISEEAVFGAVAIATILYLAAANFFQYKSSNWDSVEKFGLARIFDALTFSGSAALLAGLFEPRIMHALGSTKPFLFFAALAGLIYSLHALRPKLNKRSDQCLRAAGYAFG